MILFQCKAIGQGQSLHMPTEVLFCLNVFIYLYNRPIKDSFFLASKGSMLLGCLYTSMVLARSTNVKKMMLCPA